MCVGCSGIVLRLWVNVRHLCASSSSNRTGSCLLLCCCALPTVVVAVIWVVASVSMCHRITELIARVCMAIARIRGTYLNSWLLSRGLTVVMAVLTIRARM